jgi:uncharacterized protein
MVASSANEPSRPGKYILQYRAPIGLTLIAITAFMALWAARVQIGTKFENFFPANHPDTLLYRQFQYQYGGAQTLLLMLRVKDGDIFNYKTLHKIQDITGEVNILPGVDHNQVFSLASYRVAFTRALPGALISTCFMYPTVPATRQELDQLKQNVAAHHEPVAGLITYDNKGALVRASFNERGLDYKALLDGIQSIISRYSDDNTVIYVAGQPVVSGWGYYYLPRITVIFLVSIALMLFILYLSLGQRSSWWAPILTGSFSAIWGLGFVSLMRYTFDPVMLVIPFILTARDLSHGIQWQGRYYDELDRLDDKLLACATTTDVMLPPGLLSILADIAGMLGRIAALSSPAGIRRVQSGADFDDDAGRRKKCLRDRSEKGQLRCVACQSEAKPAPPGTAGKHRGPIPVGALAGRDCPAYTAIGIGE